MKIDVRITALLLAFILTGCMGYRHSRDFSQDRHKESTTLVTLFKKGEAAVVQSETRDGDYSRNVGATAVRGSVDSKGIDSTGGAIGEGAKAFVKP